MSYKDPEKQREYQRIWLQRRRDAWFADKRCEWCGIDKALELDHVDAGEKVAHQIWSWTEERRVAELAKCRVLCSTCHRERHAQEDRFPCGTSASYQRGCHCSACRAGEATRRRNDRRLKKVAGRGNAPRRPEVMNL